MEIDMHTTSSIYGLFYYYTNPPLHIPSYLFCSLITRTRIQRVSFTAGIAGGKSCEMQRLKGENGLLKDYKKGHFEYNISWAARTITPTCRYSL